jgi:hypothetical protein
MEISSQWTETSHSEATAAHVVSRSSQWRSVVKGPKRVRSPVCAPLFFFPWLCRESGSINLAVLGGFWPVTAGCGPETPALGPRP